MNTSLCTELARPDGGWEIDVNVDGCGFSRSDDNRLDCLRNVLSEMDRHIELVDERRKIIAEKIVYVEALSRKKEG